MGSFDRSRNPVMRSPSKLNGAFSETQRFIDALRTSRSRGEVELLLEQITRDMGFDFYALVHHVDHRDKQSAYTGCAMTFGIHLLKLQVEHH